MKGRLKKINDKWVVEYSGVSYKGGNPKQLGNYTKKVEKKTLPLHPNFVIMTDYVWVKGIKVYDGDVVKFTEVLVNPMGREVDPKNLSQNHSKCVWCAKPYLDEKDEQKQRLIDMMKLDEELGLYDEGSPLYNHQVKLVNVLAKKIKLEQESREIKVEDIFNDEKRENIKKFIDEIKNPSEPNQALKDAAERLKGLSLVNPTHLQMTSNGHGEFPDGYKLTEKGIQYIIEQLNKEEQKEKENDWEEILFDFIDFYPCILPHELFEWLEENYEIPKKKDGK